MPSRITTLACLAVACSGLSVSPAAAKTGFGFKTAKFRIQVQGVQTTAWKSDHSISSTACGTAYKEKRPDACLECGDLLRPDVVLFGEMLPPGAFEFAAARASQCELCFVVGTSALVYPAAALPEIAKAASAYVVEVNPERTPLSSLCDEVLTGKAGEVLPLF